MTFTVRLLILFSALLPPPSEPPVTMVVESTLPSAPGQIRQFAFDGDPKTFFATASDAGPGDPFTLRFDRPVTIRSISVLTGRPDGSERLEAGTIEVSTDGESFRMAATIKDGTARGEPRDGKVRAIRVRPAGDSRRPLSIRELTIDSDPRVAPFKYPVEFVVDVADAPELKDWAERVARLCEAWYPRINEELASDGFRPPTVVKLALKSSYNGVAMAGGGRITGSVKYFKAHPDDLGAMIHETCHIVQRYRRGNNPGWLVEGVADYVRFFIYEPPGKIGPINAERAHYNNSYRVSARFLRYLTETYDKAIVLKLNRLMREGKYTNESFKELTGKDLKTLDTEWRASLKAGKPRV